MDGLWPEVLHPSKLTATTSPAAFWQPLRHRVGEVADLAFVLHSIPPHAAAPERLFSTMGWFEEGRRTCLGVSTNAKLATIKMHVDQQQAKPRTERARHSPEGDLALDLDDATAEEVDEELARIADKSGWVQAPLPQVTRQSFSSLLFEAWDGFDMRAACLDLRDPIVGATQSEAAFVPAGDGEDFDIEEVLCTRF